MVIYKPWTLASSYQYSLPGAFPSHLWYFSTYIGSYQSSRPITNHGGYLFTNNPHIHVCVPVSVEYSLSVPVINMHINDLISNYSYLDSTHFWNWDLLVTSLCKYFINPYSYTCLQTQFFLLFIFVAMFLWDPQYA
jgi:hypothetical protein